MTQGCTVITGASSGIGKALAQNFFEHSKKIIIVARTEEKLRQLADELKDKYDEVYVFAADLTKQEDIEKLVDYVHKELKEKVQHLVNNAGFGLIGNFNELDIKEQLDIVQLNICALMSLSHAFLEDIIFYARQNHRAGILNISSIAGYLPGPSFAVYFASKAFVSSFSAAISQELKKEKVRVCSYCPGPVSTDFLLVAGAKPENTARNNRGIPSAHQTALDAIDAYSKGRSVRIQGFVNRLSILFSRFVPTFLMAKMVVLVNSRRYK